MYYLSPFRLNNLFLKLQQPNFLLNSFFDHLGAHTKPLITQKTIILTNIYVLRKWIQKGGSSHALQIVFLLIHIDPSQQTHLFGVLRCLSQALTVHELQQQK